MMEPNITRNHSEDLDLTPLVMKDIGWQTSNITIPHLKYASWLSENDLTATDADAAPTADYDQDGISNLLEYVASGTPVDPSNASSQPLTLDVDSTLTYQRSSVLNDIETAYQSSSDLINWTTYTPEETVSSISDGIESVTTPLPETEENQFYRLEHTLAE